MPTEPEYIDYTDKIVESILKNESLSEDDKISSIAEHYKNLLLQGGSSSQSVKRNEKEIRESIIYQRVKIENAFKSYNFYNNESVLNTALAPIRLMEEALSHALVFIVTNVKAEVQPNEQHVFNEAKRLGWSVDQTKQHQEELLELGNRFSKFSKYGLFFGGGFALGFILLIQLFYNQLTANGSINSLRNVPMTNVILGGVGLVLIIFSSPGYFRFLYDLFSIWFGKRKSLRQTQDFQGKSGDLFRKGLIIGFFPIVLVVSISLIIYSGLGIVEEKVEKEKVIRQEKVIVENTCKLKTSNKNGVPFYKETLNRKADSFLKDGTIFINSKITKSERPPVKEKTPSDSTDRDIEQLKSGLQSKGIDVSTYKYIKINIKDTNQEGWINDFDLNCY